VALLLDEADVVEVVEDPAAVGRTEAIVTGVVDVEVMLVLVDAGVEVMDEELPASAETEPLGRPEPRRSAMRRRFTRRWRRSKTGCATTRADGVRGRALERPTPRESRSIYSSSAATLRVLVIITPFGQTSRHRGSAGSQKARGRQVEGRGRVCGVLRLVEARSCAARIDWRTPIPARAAGFGSTARGRDARTSGPIHTRARFSQQQCIGDRHLRERDGQHSFRD
jgi:hypothetical protein